MSSSGHGVVYALQTIACYDTDSNNEHGAKPATLDLKCRGFRVKLVATDLNDCFQDLISSNSSVQIWTAIIDVLLVLSYEFAWFTNTRLEYSR